MNATRLGAVATALVMTLTVDARRVAEPHQVVACMTKGSELSQLLAEPSVAQDLRECVAPLLFAGFKYVDPADSTAYCASDPCKRVVRQLSRLPSCSWTTLSTEGEESDDVEMAKRVMADCTR